MGYRCSWVAVCGKPVAEVLGFLGLKPTGERLEYSDVGFNLLRSRDGWCVVIGDGSDAMTAIEKNHACELSANAAAIWFETDDTPMCSELSYYADRARLWAIKYDGNGGVSAPEIVGEPAADYAEIVGAVVREMTEEQKAEGDDVDCLYDITKLVGFRITGFRHDGRPDVEGDEPLEVLDALE